MSNLTRYDLEHSSVKHHRELVPSTNGDWVKFDDIKETISLLHETRPDIETIARKVNDIINRLNGRREDPDRKTSTYFTRLQGEER